MGYENISGAGGGAVTLRKTADQTVNNSTTLVNATDMVLPVNVNDIYKFEILVRMEATAVADMKVGWTVPAGATMSWREGPTSAPTPELTDSSTDLMSGSGAGVDAIGSYHGVIIIGATAGSVQMQFAQNTAEVSDTKLLTNTIGIFHKVT